MAKLSFLILSAFLYKIFFKNFHKKSLQIIHLIQNQFYIFQNNLLNYALNIKAY